MCLCHVSSQMWLSTEDFVSNRIHVKCVSGLWESFMQRGNLLYWIFQILWLWFAGIGRCLISYIFDQYEIFPKPSLPSMTFYCSAILLLTNKNNMKFFLDPLSHPLLCYISLTKNKKNMKISQNLLCHPWQSVGLKLHWLTVAASSASLICSTTPKISKDAASAASFALSFLDPKVCPWQQ